MLRRQGPHDIERVQEPGALVPWYRCTKCLRSWKWRPSRKDCQGIPCYPVRKYRPSHLFTVRELAHKHLQPGSEAEGYVPMLRAPYWVYLYDIHKAVPLPE